MESCLYEGHVYHRRRTPVEHGFRFSLCLLYLDLEEIPAVFGASRLWSATGPALVRFRREDHLGPDDQPLSESVRDLVEERSGSRPTGPVRLLTHPRYAGIGMNPVSFYYCFEPDGEGLAALVAEVNNTPWGEQHCYVLPAADGHGLSARQRKQFHVSPFMPMELDYAWSSSLPGEELELRIANHSDDGELLFDAVLSLERRPLTSRNRARLLGRHPLQTARVAAAIYWQALRLALKGTPFHPHPRHAAAPMETLS